MSQFPNSVKLYFKNDKAPDPGEIFVNKAPADLMKRLVEAEQKALAEGKAHSQALEADRDRFYKGDIAREFVEFTNVRGLHILTHGPRYPVMILLIPLQPDHQPLIAPAVSPSIRRSLTMA